MNILSRRRPAVNAPLSVATGAALVLAALCLPGLRAWAGTTARWTVDGYEQFDDGETDSAIISSTGEVRPGWQTHHVDLDEVGGTWAAVRARGGTLYLGTDDDGAVYSVSGGKAKKLTSIQGAVAIVSLALGNDGALYAGTMPAGQIWRIDPTSGKSRKLAELKGAETVWSLAVDKAHGDLYAGTGPDGKLYRVNPRTGAARMVFATQDKRILSMVATDDGAIWFGTSDNALLFRYDPRKNSTRAMADFAGNEITALAEAKGTVIAAANELKEPSTTGVKTAAAVKAAAGKDEGGEKAKSEGKKPGTDKEKSGTEPTRKGKRKGKGALYRVHGDGQLEQLHALTETYFTAIAVNDRGQIFAGAGDKGRIYLVDVDDSVSTAFDVNQRQISQMWVAPGGALGFVTGDGTSLYTTTGRAGKATYTSKVFDAKAPAHFGGLVWRSGGKVAIETRTGNTEEPGPGWSGWQKPAGLHRAGGGAERGRVVSPPGRYVQYRAHLASDDAVLRATSLYYLPQNRPTRLTEVTVEGQSWNKHKSLEATPGVHSPVIKVKWKVDNDDGDETLYKLAVRREGDVRWRRVATGSKPLTGTSFDWNTETYPDGFYRLRVTASDGRANGGERALETHMISGVFPVDNQKPRIGDVNVRYPAASARAVDALSALTEMSYSIDDGPWHLGAPADGLFDDTTEMLKIRLPDDLDSGAHTLAIRVADEAGNIGSTAVTFRVK